MFSDHCGLNGVEMNQHSLAEHRKSSSAGGEKWGGDTEEGTSIGLWGSMVSMDGH